MLYVYITMFSAIFTMGNFFDVLDLVVCCLLNQGLVWVQYNKKQSKSFHKLCAILLVCIKETKCYRTHKVETTPAETLKQ